MVRRERPTGAEASAARRREANSVTGRAAVLAVVVCLLAISLAYPLRQYLSQRGDIRELSASVAGAERRVAELDRLHDRWQAPAYVEAQARERLHYVMPGETSYVVLEADDAPVIDGVVEPATTREPRRPWFSDLWRTVEVAGEAR